MPLVKSKFLRAMMTRLPRLRHSGVGGSEACRETGCDLRLWYELLKRLRICGNDRISDCSVTARQTTLEVYRKTVGVRAGRLVEVGTG